jgi:hypothetical protein
MGDWLAPRIGAGRDGAGARTGKSTSSASPGTTSGSTAASDGGDARRATYASPARGRLGASWLGASFAGPALGADALGAGVGRLVSTAT